MIETEIKATQSGTTLAEIEAALKALSKKSLLLGIMAEQRKAEKDEKLPLTNSQLGFIFEFGAPEVKIPARPILGPVVKDNQADIIATLKLAAGFALQGDDESVDRTLHSLGIRLVVAVKKHILNVIPPPLSAKTLRKWITPRKQRKDYGETPLKVTAQFLNAFNYVVRNR